MLIVGIEAKHFGERLRRAIDEAAALVVEPEAQQHVGVLQLPQLGTLQQQLVLLNRPADLSFLSIQVAEDEVNLERIAGNRCGARELVDRRVGLVGDQKVQPSM